MVEKKNISLIALKILWLVSFFTVSIGYWAHGTKDISYRLFYTPFTFEWAVLGFNLTTNLIYFFLVWISTFIILTMIYRIIFSPNNIDFLLYVYGGGFLLIQHIWDLFTLKFAPVFSLRLIQLGSYALFFLLYGYLLFFLWKRKNKGKSNYSI